VPLRQKWNSGAEITSATAAETTDLTQWGHRGSGAVGEIASKHTRQKGMGLPVSSIREQIRHGAGSTSDASDSQIPRKWARTELATPATVRPAYAGSRLRGSKMWHDSCQRFESRTLQLAGVGPCTHQPPQAEAC